MSTNTKHKRTFRRQLAALMLILVGLLWWYNHHAEQLENKGLLPVVFENPNGTRSPSFNLEIAANNEERTRGLMYRRELKPDHGMIFIFTEDKIQSFWMKNTYISLDMLFIDRDLQVVGILENVPILNEQPRTVGIPSRYVVELLAGTASRFGIVRNSKLLPAIELPRGL